MSLATATQSNCGRPRYHDTQYCCDSNGEDGDKEVVETEPCLLLAPAPLCWFEEESFRADDDNDNINVNETLQRHDSQQINTQFDDLIARQETNNRIGRYAPPRPRQVLAQQPLPPNIHHHTSVVTIVPCPSPSPSWRDISCCVLPAAARELLTTSLQRITYTARLSYAHAQWHRNYSELGSNASGYFRTHLSATSNTTNAEVSQQLPLFSSLSWVERQLVPEWRTYRPEEKMKQQQRLAVSEENNNKIPSLVLDDEESSDDFECARTLVPAPVERPVWQRAEVCFACHKPFGPTRLRHHCRLCGKSVCQTHASHTHKLPHLGYDSRVPERVCDPCWTFLVEQNLAERVAWRLARCRDVSNGSLRPYFETGVDTVEQVAWRITKAALAMARSIPLGAQATVAVETVDVLRKHGLNGIYTVLLRQEFLAAADLLRKALGINRTAWPLSVHELSAAIFYALAQHRAMRGMNPEREQWIHRFREEHTVAADNDDKVPGSSSTIPYGADDDISQSIYMNHGDAASTRARPVCSSSQPVCDPLPDSSLSSLIFYAAMALNFIYQEKEVDMQLLAAQQGWRLVYAHLEQEASLGKQNERPASALFLHEEQKVVCLAVRGTATIHDVVTDIRQTPVPFPDLPEFDPTTIAMADESDGWTTIFRGQGLAVSGMAGAAVNLYRENIDSLLWFARRGYRVRLTGHSLGGGVASLLGLLVYRDLEQMMEMDNVDFSTHKEQTIGTGVPSTNTNVGGAFLKVYAYGTPSCVDGRLADCLGSFVTTVVLHDDVVPRLTPVSCRALSKHLLHIRETWVKEHLTSDILAITERAKTAWAPRWRGSFTLSTSPSSIKRYCRKQYHYGKRKLLSVKEKIAGEKTVVSERGSSVYYAETAKISEEHGDLVNVIVEEALTGDNFQDENECPPRLLLDFMGGIDNRFEGVVIDGEEFFEPTESLLEEEETVDEASSLDSTFGAFQGHEKTREYTLVTANVCNIDPESQLQEDLVTPGAVVLEEAPLPRMFIPGKVVHIYADRGVYRAAYVPRNFRELRRISLAGNCLSDHKAKSYFEALLEVRTVRDATEDPPRWTAFDEDDICSCCASRFTWASTSDNEAQEARDKHNCRSCGTLVCDACSKNRIPLPSIGVTAACRVCDRCYNDIDGIVLKPFGLTSSFIASNPKESSPRSHSFVVIEKPIRQRDRRSLVVDEFASRLHTSVSCS